MRQPSNIQWRLYIPSSATVIVICVVFFLVMKCYGSAVKLEWKYFSLHTARNVYPGWSWFRIWVKGNIFLDGDKHIRKLGGKKKTVLSSALFWFNLNQGSVCRMWTRTGIQDRAVTLCKDKDKETSVPLGTLRCLQNICLNKGSE